ncbi:MAG: Flp pilus assembly protein CpaB, partial [Burkholderiaceae bacterium]|nr:Flp pilus assembly protein CpaB [Burkholderiaceae bacterium]
LTPDQAEKLDLARSVGTLSLVLRNQIDPSPVNTGGATKASLLDVRAVAVPEAKPAPAAKPAKKRMVVARAPAPARAPSEQVEVIKGLDRSTQQF